ncbi:hypothetical protein ColKHC_01432 [Colletotrichum higginsianum]|nr:hypothetical protein ColKHC_01432 [Colletotrichum higginsianum]
MGLGGTEPAAAGPVVAGPAAGPGTNRTAATNRSGQGQGGAPGPRTGSGSGSGPIGRRTSSLKTTGSPQKKLTPPPQLHERNLLLHEGPPASVSVSVSVNRPRYPDHPHHHHQQHHRLPEAPQPPHRSQSLSVQEQQQQQQQETPFTQRLQIHLRGGTAERSNAQGQKQGHAPQFQPVQPYQFQVPGREPGGLGEGGGGGGGLSSGPRSRDTIANYNRKHRETHNPNHWPDTFRSPRGGLGIEHSTDSNKNSKNNTPETPLTPPDHEAEAGRPKTRPDGSELGKE